MDVPLTLSGSLSPCSLTFTLSVLTQTDTENDLQEHNSFDVEDDEQFFRNNEILNSVKGLENYLAGKENKVGPYQTYVNDCHKYDLHQFVKSMKC